MHPDFTPPAKIDNRIPFDHLMVLRGLFCVAVVEGHSYGLIPENKRQLIAKILTFHGFSFEFLICGIAPAAVWGFFILSGYLIGKGFYAERYPLTWKGAARFYGNRLKRILPLYYFVLLIASIFVAPEVFDFGSKPHTAVIPLFFFFSNEIGPIYFPDVGHLWSLSTEMQFYLLAPLLAFVFLRFFRTFNAAFPFFILLLIISISWRWEWCVVHPVSNDDWVYRFYFPLWSNIEFFLAGFLATPVIRSLRQRSSSRQIINYPKTTRLGVYIFFLSSLGLIAWVQTAWGKGEHWGYVGFMGFLPAFTILITVISVTCFELCTNSSSPRNKPLPDQFLLIRQHPARIFELFGILTYGIYLWHLPILMKLYPYLSEPNPILHFVELFGTVLAVATLVASITYHFIEYPFDAKKRFD